MEMEYNRLAAHLSQTRITLKGVYHYAAEPQTVGTQRSAPLSGFVFTLAGQAQLSFDGTRYLADTENVIHGGSDMLLEKKVLGSGKWEYISVLYHAEPPEPQGLCLAQSHFKLTIGKSPRLIELLRRLRHSFYEPGALEAFRTETLFYCVLEEMLVCARGQSCKSNQQLFDEICTYIHEHFSGPLTVKILAERSGINENRIYYLFKKYAGMGPGDYLSAYRLNRAKELLITSAQSICDVALNCGYADSLYFSRLFAKRFGCPPSRFREEFKNNPYRFKD